MNEENIVEMFSELVMRHYVNSEGVYLGGWDQNPPEGSIEVSPHPMVADQVWLFSTVDPFWTESPSQASSRENEWREGEYSRATKQLEMLEDEDPSAEPGTPKQWKSYRIALRAWTEGSPDFPEIIKRPQAPS